MSNDMDKTSSDNLEMSHSNEELAFNIALCARVRMLRESLDWSAEIMAEALGVPAARYRKYENRTNLPHYLIPRFARLTGYSVEYVLTGREPGRNADRHRADQDASSASRRDPRLPRRTAGGH
jgi:transcriptional regulator with XRE-family HTH domain